MLSFGAAVLYVDDVPSVVRFYDEAFGVSVRYRNESVGFAQLGEDGYLTLASHAAGELMMGDGYHRSGGGPMGVEIAFVTEDVAAAFERAVRTGALAVSTPREMPWGQTAAYVRSVEGTLVGLLTHAPPPPSTTNPAAAEGSESSEGDP